MEQQKQLHLIMEWDLQWFAKDGPGGEKTEPATAKKLREAREDGKVVKSKELTAAFDLIVLFLVLKIFVSFVGNRLMNSFVDIYGRIPDFVRENAVDVTEKRIVMIMVLAFDRRGAVQRKAGRTHDLAGADAGTVCVYGRGLHPLCAIGQVCPV